jgi:hypothetical protein
MGACYEDWDMAGGWLMVFDQVSSIEQNDAENILVNGHSDSDSRSVAHSHGQSTFLHRESRTPRKHYAASVRGDFTTRTKQLLAIFCSTLKSPHGSGWASAATERMRRCRCLGPDRELPVVYLDILKGHAKLVEYDWHLLRNILETLRLLSLSMRGTWSIHGLV